MKYQTGSEAALESAMSGKPTIIFGRAGTRKSTIIHSLMEFFSYDTLLTAPSGVAARNIGGSTLHSTFKIPVGFDLKMPRIQKKHHDVLAASKLNRIIFDEFGMIRADSLDAVNTRLQQCRGNNLPFGGVTPIFFGDLLQFPPILQNGTQEAEAYKQHYDGLYVFNSKVWQDIDFNIIELTDVHRQSNVEFVNTLNNIREGINIRESVSFINDNYNKAKAEDVLILATTRKLVADYNLSEFRKLSGAAKTYPVRKMGKTTDLSVDGDVSLKVGARVMITANAPNGDYFNGSLGRVCSMRSTEVVVDLDNGGRVVVPYITIPCYEYITDREGNISRKEVGKAEYMPMMLGYSCTINRCQGLTLDSINVDFSWGCFSSGQAYTALSRVKELNGLYMKRPLKQKDIIVDRNAINWIKQVRG